MNNNVKIEKKLTRGTKALIGRAIKETESSNRYELLEWVAEDLCDRFEKGCLEYQLGRMGIETSSEVLDAIDTYVYRYAKQANKK